MSDEAFRARAKRFAECLFRTPGIDGEQETPWVELVTNAIVNEFIPETAVLSEDVDDEPIVLAEIDAQILEAEWWNEEGLDLENYISPEDVQKRFNFLRNVRKDILAKPAQGSEPK